MKDIAGKVMYVGKAKNLKNRVRSYFDRTWELSVAKKQMVAKVVDIELITCETEVEALVLETNLIKHISPKYNILMKDDKNLAYLKFTNSPVPELVKTRKKIRDGGIYFGPFVSRVEESVRALRKIFRIRNCRVKFAHIGNRLTITDKAGKTLPCMDYYIWLCPAPCILSSDSLIEHDTHISRAKSFLSGDTVSVFAELTIEMQTKAKNLEFEEAQSIKTTLEALKWLYERQSVRDIIDGDVDICIQYEKYEKTYIGYTQIRASQIVWVFRYEVDIHASDKDDVIVEFLMRQYLHDDRWGEDFPDVLYIAVDIVDESFLGFLRKEKVKIEIPKIWPKKDMVDFTQNQLREYAYKRELASLENNILTREHMKNVLKRLCYDVPEKWEIVFECYDISHTDGHFTYASRVCIVDGKPDTKRYKKYKIKTLVDGDIDDYAAHREVMVRRTLEWIEQSNFPHLIIIDGGKWQLSSALSGIKEWKWKYEKEYWEIQNENMIIQICSIAKREEEIFLPWNKIPVLFEKGTPELMVLQKARDESHRFSITANKTARMKSMKKNILEEIPWIGPITRKKLLKLAGSIDEIRNIKLEEIEKICTKWQMQTLIDHGIL